MKPGDRQLLGRILEASPVLALGVLVDGRPYVGQLPFALWAERSSLLVHVSGLARHSRGLSPGAPFSALISGEGEDPFQIPRLTVEGEAHRPAPGSAEHDEAKSVFLGKLPSAAGHFQLGDFSLIELRVARARFVAGFARAYNVTAGQLGQVVADFRSA